jgi:leucyl aminopeptidase
MKDALSADDTSGARPLYAVTEETLGSWLDGMSSEVRAWVQANDFKGKPGSSLILPGADGAIAGVLCGISSPVDIWDLGGLALSLPDGSYLLGGVAADDPKAAGTLVLGWILGAYKFRTYKKDGRKPARLVPPKGVDLALVETLAEATYMVRDLINTPANDMGPTALAEAAKELAARFGADYAEVVGERLLEENYPAVHAVGRAAADAPRIVELTWGDSSKPTVALVGKGVCFDTGGLDIKPASGMKLMKKDMGGAAHVLGIAHVLMALKADIHLKVLIPAVENSISGNAMRPMDIVSTRAGLTIEVANTDAEGRIILSDALARAGEASPEMIFDFATLTGAARVALGTELPALFCNNDALADALLASGTAVQDPLWRLPLWPGYRKMIEGSTADINNAPEGGYAGAITAALFLEKFVDAKTPWVHIDVMAYNRSSQAGRPEGGEAMGMRAVANLILERFGKG